MRKQLLFTFIISTCFLVIGVILYSYTKQEVCPMFCTQSGCFVCYPLHPYYYISLIFLITSISIMLGLLIYTIRKGIRSGKLILFKD